MLPAAQALRNLGNRINVIYCWMFPNANSLSVSSSRQLHCDDDDDVVPPQVKFSLFRNNIARTPSVQGFTELEQAFQKYLEDCGSLTKVENVSVSATHIYVTVEKLPPDAQTRFVVAGRMAVITAREGQAELADELTSHAGNLGRGKDVLREVSFRKKLEADAVSVFSLLHEVDAYLRSLELAVDTVKWDGAQLSVWLEVDSKEAFANQRDALPFSYQQLAFRYFPIDSEGSRLSPHAKKHAQPEVTLVRA